jgi:hypothetical protein
LSVQNILFIDLEQSLPKSVSSVCSGLKLASTRQKLDIDIILCLREPGAGEIIVDEAKYEDGQKVGKTGSQKN